MNLHKISAHAGKIGRAVDHIQQVKEVLKRLNGETASLKISVCDSGYTMMELSAIKDSEVEAEIFCTLISEYNQRLAAIEKLKELIEES